MIWLFQSALDPAAWSAAAQFSQKDATADELETADASGIDRGRITVPGSCLSTRPPSRQQLLQLKLPRVNHKLQQPLKTCSSSRVSSSSGRKLMSRGGASMFLTGEEEDAEEEEMEEAGVDVIAKSLDSPKAAAAAAAAVKYQSLIDVAQRRFNLLQVAETKFCTKFEYCCIRCHPYYAVGCSRLCFLWLHDETVKCFLILEYLQLISASDCIEEKKPGIAENYVRACLQR
jgi:hypothetical protein